MICAGDGETKMNIQTEVVRFLSKLLLSENFDAGSTSPCNYDQGSPLVQATDTGNIVVGIMSKNRGCVAPYPPTIYTRLASYYPWLKQSAGQQPASL
jgi:secreted trypsin-like serine protease